MADWYVSEAGSDTTGTGAIGAPWRTYAHAKVNSSNGDYVFFNGGDVFRETVDQSGGAKRFLRSYGTGRAAISAADDYSTAAHRWVASGSGTNEWRLEAAAGGDPGLANPSPPFLLLDGVLIHEGTPGALADHEYGTVVIGGTYTTLVLRDNSGDPDTTGVLVEVPVRSYCIVASGTLDFDLDGLEWYGATLNGAHLWNAAGDHRLGNFRVHDVRFQGILSGQDPGWGGMTITYFGGIEADHCGNTGISIGGAEDGVHAIFESGAHVEAHHNAWTSDGDPSNAGVRQVAFRFGYMTIEDGAFIHCYDNVGAAEGSRGFWLDGVIGAGPSLVQNVLCERNLVNFQIESSWDVELYNCISVDAGLDGFYLVGSVYLGEAWSLARVHFHHCVSVGSAQAGLGVYGGFGWQDSDTVIDCEFRNNIFVDNLYEMLILNGAGNTNTPNGRGSGNLYTHNCFGPNHANMVRWEYTNYSTYAAWEAVHTQAAGTNVEVDPELINVAGGDFRPLITSPLREAGMTLAPPTVDYAGGPRQGRPTIGPYELPPRASMGATGLGV